MKNKIYYYIFNSVLIILSNIFYYSGLMWLIKRKTTIEFKKFYNEKGLQ